MEAYAILLNGSTDDIGPTVNGLKYAIALDDSDFDVEVYFDGSATQWPGTLVEEPHHPVNAYFEDADDRGLIAGACGYCARAFGGARGCEDAGIELVGDQKDHGPDVGELVIEGYGLITIG